MVNKKDIAVATPKQIENILIDVCKESGIDKKIVTVFICTGGLHYVFEKIAKELYLLPKIDRKIHSIMRAIDIGFDIRKNFENLYEANYSLENFKKQGFSWGLEERVQEVEKLRSDFLMKVKGKDNGANARNT